MARDSKGDDEVGEGEVDNRQETGDELRCYT